MEVRTPGGGYVTRSANPLQPWGSTAPPSNGMLGISASGMQVNEQTALQLAAVYGSVSLISESIAPLPLRQFKLVKGAPVEMPLAPVVDRPWPEITRRDFVIQGTMSLLLRGNLFGRVTDRDDRLLLPTQVQLVHPKHARVTRNRYTGAVEVRYWDELVPPDDVTRAMALSVPEGLVGLNPIEYMRNVLGLARSYDVTAGAFMANSARPDLVIRVPNDLPPDEARAMKDSWLESFQGPSRTGMPAVLTGGAEVEPITMNFVDAQFLEQMQFSESVISGRIYRVPPHMLGMVDKDTSWGSGIEQQELGFVRNTLLIWLCRWEDLMRSWLPPGQFVTFDLSHRLRGDTLQRWSAYQIARVIGAMSNAEVREAEGLPVVTDPAQAAVLDDFAAPLNSAPVKPTSTGGAGGDKAN